MAMNTVDEILAAARALPSAEQAKLIPLLWDNLSPEDWALPADEWVQEANRRSNAIDNGEMPVKPWNEARTEARRKAGLDG
jgi:putative addiction module component (TIGR02574 family)